MARAKQNNPSGFNHDWLCKKLAEFESFIQDVLSLSMTPNQLDLFDISKGRFLDPTMNTDTGSKRTADFVFEVPFNAKKFGDGSCFVGA